MRKTGRGCCDRSNRTVGVRAAFGFDSLDKFPARDAQIEWWGTTRRHIYPKSRLPIELPNSLPHQYDNYISLNKQMDSNKDIQHVAGLVVQG
jgi:hypothetical protein